MYRRTLEDYDKVAFVFVPVWRKENQRAWQQYNEETCEWEPRSASQAFRAVVEVVETVLGLQGYPERFYRENFYGNLANDCHKSLRPHVLQELMTLKPAQDT